MTCAPTSRPMPTLPQPNALWHPTLATLPRLIGSHSNRTDSERSEAYAMRKQHRSGCARVSAHYHVITHTHTHTHSREFRIECVALFTELEMYAVHMSKMIAPHAAAPSARRWPHNQHQLHTCRPSDSMITPMAHNITTKLNRQFAIAMSPSINNRIRGRNTQNSLCVLCSARAPATKRG